MEVDTFFAHDVVLLLNFLFFLRDSGELTINLSECVFDDLLSIIQVEACTLLRALETLNYYQKKQQCSETHRVVR